MFAPNGVSVISTCSVNYGSETQSSDPANSPIHPLLGATANADLAWRVQVGSPAPSARASEPPRLYAMCLGVFNPTFLNFEYLRVGIERYDRSAAGGRARIHVSRQTSTSRWL